ncbi:MAG: AsmA-like C-terminal domain-containing protein [Thermodesulfobacteriota bacterium]
MNKYRKVSALLVGGLGLIVILAVLSLLFVKRLVSPERVKEDLRAYLSLKIGGTVEFGGVEINYMPGPHVVLRDGQFSVPGRMEGSFETLIVYPKVLPLLKGRVEVSRLKIIRPEIKIFVHEPPAEEIPGSDDSFSFGILKDNLKGALDNLDSHGSGLNARIEDGTLVLQKDSAPALSFSGMNADLTLPDDKLRISVKSASNLWDSFDFRAWIDVKNHQGSGSLHIRGGKPHRFMDFYLPDKKIVSDSGLNLALKFDTRDLNVFHSTLSASVPKLVLTGGGEELDLSASDIDADLYFDDVKQVLSLESAKLINPGLDLSGKYTVDKKLSTVSLSLLGKNVDVVSVRNGALFIAGERKVTDSIFEVVRGGTVPQVTLDAEAPSFGELWKKGNFRIEGDMVNGRIYIPPAEFDIVEANGHAVIEGGLLKGTNLSGKLGNSKGHDGTLLLGLGEPPDGPFTLDIMIDADPSQVPPVIEQFVRDESVKNEMRLIKNVRGTATGRLVLGEKKRATKAKISVSGFDFTAEYDGRFPFPVRVKGGTFDYQNNKIVVANVAADMGKSSSTLVSGSYEWGDNDYFSVASADTSLDLGEFHPWLSSFASLKPGLGEIQSASGTAFFKTLEFSGAPSNPGGWDVSGEGELRAVSLGLAGFGDLITVTGADIRSTPGQFSISNAAVSLRGSVVTMEMALSNYLTDLLQMRVDFSGTLEPAAMDELSGYIDLPEELVFTSPLSVKDSSLVLGNGREKPGAGALGPSGTPVKNPGKKLSLTLNIETDNLEWQDSPKDAPQNQQPPRSAEWNSPVLGAVNLKSQNFKFKKLNWDSVDSVITFLDHGVNIDVNSAKLCGISTPGLLRINPPGLRFEFKPAATGGEIASVIKCLLDKAGIISGDLDLQATISSDGSPGRELYNNLKGTVELNSRSGRVEKYGGLAKFFTVLNFGELFRGDGPDFEKHGFPYDKLTAKADVEEGKIQIREAVMDGPSIKVVCEGFIDLVNMRLDLELLVIPVMAVDSVIEKIPLVNFLLGKNFVSIPIKVTGDISDPHVTTISPTAVSFGLLGLIKQTLNIPVTIFKPVSRNGDAGDKKESSGKDLADENQPTGHPAESLNSDGLNR